MVEKQIEFYWRGSCPLCPPPPPPPLAIYGPAKCPRQYPISAGFSPRPNAVLHGTSL